MGTQFGDIGQAIWDAYEADKLNAGHQALVREYARLADIADRLNDLVKGRRETWFTLAFDEMGEIHVQVDKMLDQQRSTQLALRAVHGELRQAGVKAKDASTAEVKAAEPEDALAKFRKMKEERERQSG